MSATSPPDIEALSTREVYSNRWMRVREDAVRRLNGSEGIYGVVEKPDYALIVPIEDGRLHLVQQFRFPVQGRYWEFPQGCWETAPDTAPEIIARAELREETGLSAAIIRKVGYLYQAYGYSNQGCHIFLATDLTAGSDDRDAEEADLITGSFSVTEVEAMLLNGDIRDAMSVAAFGLLRSQRLL